MSPRDTPCATLFAAPARTPRGGGQPLDRQPLDPQTERISQLLTQAPLFNGLAQAEIARFAHGVREQKVERNAVLFHRGDPCHGFHLVLTGQVKLAFISAAGHEKVVEIIRAGQTFGEAVMFMDKPYVVMAQPLGDCSLLHISKQVVFEEMERDPLFCRKIIAGLAQRLHHLVADVETYSLRSGRERVVGYLLREEKEGDAASNGPAGALPGTERVTVRLPTSKGTIASRLNLTQEHFSRILHELIESGLIVVQGRTIHIPDLGRLRRSLN
ncbi:cyclic nucleotide-binding domain-containing protein [Azoarcus indigens]|uniref:CRP-like cAMP-binding protein n=1 Tax=Azoarcus indigens TaxID=29545 RepID=A0A4R6EEE9_9RHOO|nr:Crp/Fnr family transcriptional regulator [Azoarcus indigens]NMG67588.1 cyclic nucleotide-binding domain-containing protein [Azoarcus indigens]TDN56124.1 CRP-like cAMP-binding protein [Azoarcus indigens]